MDKRSLLRECAENLLLLTQLGLSLALPPILCLYAANWLCRRWAIGAWLMVLALILGLGASVVNVWKLYQRLKKREKRK